MILLAAIVRAEARLHLRRRGYWLLFALFAALALVAGVLNRERQVRDRAQQLAYQQLVRSQWEAQPDRHPHRVAHYGTFAFRPPGPLAAFDPGVESYAGRVQYLEAHRQNAANFAEAGGLSSVFRLGELSHAFLLQLVLPLIAIALGHRVWAGENEAGRLRLLLGQGVSPRRLALGKFAGLALALMPFLAVAGAAALASLAGDPAFRADPQAAARLAVIAAAVALHTLGWAGFTIWVSSRLRSVASACAVLVTCWLLGALVAPRFAAGLAAARHPLPDKSSFAAAVTAEVIRQGDAHNPDDPLFARLRADTLARYGVDRVEDLPVNYGAVVMARGEELTAETFAHHFEALNATMERQARLAQRAAVFAPVLALRALSSAAAGTDLRAHLKFQREAEAFRYAFVQELNALHRDKIRYVGDRDQRLPAGHWRAFADFRAEPVTLGEALRGTGFAWLVLAAWGVLPLAALTRRKGWAT